MKINISHADPFKGGRARPDRHADIGLQLERGQDGVQGLSRAWRALHGALEASLAHKLCFVEGRGRLLHLRVARRESLPAVEVVGVSFGDAVGGVL